MKQVVVQQHEYGCGVACVAFVAGVPYQKVVSVLGVKKAASSGFLCKELVTTLGGLGSSYEFKYIKPKLRKKIYQEGVIVFIKRSKCYPSGHYLARHNGQWMDPWIDLPFNKDIKQAQAGYRKRVPSRPIYAILPH